MVKLLDDFKSFELHLFCFRNLHFYQSNLWMITKLQVVELHDQALQWDDLKFIHSFHSYHLLLTNLNDFKFIRQRHLVTNTLWWKASNSVILELLNTLREVIHTFGVYMLGMYFLAFQKILWDTPLSKESGITTDRQSNMKLFHFAT